MSFDSELSKLAKLPTKDLIEIFSAPNEWTHDEFEAAKYELEARGAISGKSDPVLNSIADGNLQSDLEPETAMKSELNLKNEMDAILHNLFAYGSLSQEYIDSTKSVWNKCFSMLGITRSYVDSIESNVYRFVILKTNYTLIHYQNKAGLLDEVEIFREEALVCKMSLRQDWVSFEEVDDGDLLWRVKRYDYYANNNWEQEFVILREVQHEELDYLEETIMNESQTEEDILADRKLSNLKIENRE